MKKIFAVTLLIIAGLFIISRLNTTNKIKIVSLQTENINPSPTPTPIIFNSGTDLNLELKNSTPREFGEEFKDLRQEVEGF